MNPRDVEDPHFLDDARGYWSLHRVNHPLLAWHHLRKAAERAGYRCELDEERHRVRVHAHHGAVRACIEIDTSTLFRSGADGHHLASVVLARLRAALKTRSAAG